MERTENPICLRYSGYFLGLNLLCLGINLNIVSQLGVAAFSTLPYTLSQIFTQLSFGQMNIIIYGILVLLQLLIERCFSLPILAEIPFSFLFGFIVDVYGALLPAAVEGMALRILVLLAGNTLRGIGVFLMVWGRLVVAPVDGIVASISRVSGWPYSLCKNCFDLSMVCTTLVLCWLWKEPFYGIGAGTVFSAFYVGRVIRFCEKKLFVGKEKI